MDSAPSLPRPLPPKPGFWQRRIVGPIVALLTQGITVEKVTQTIATGMVCSMFPLLGTTWALNLVVGLWRRMNQPILQALNQALWFVHVPMILVYVRFGEWIWRVGDEGARFSVTDMVRTFHDASFGEFLQRFGWAGVHAITAWAVTAPLLYAGVFHLARPIVRRLAWKRVPAPVP